MDAAPTTSYEKQFEFHCWRCWTNDLVLNSNEKQRSESQTVISCPQASIIRQCTNTRLTCTTIHSNYVRMTATSVGSCFLKTCLFAIHPTGFKVCEANHDAAFFLKPEHSGNRWIWTNHHMLAYPALPKGSACSGFVSVMCVEMGGGSSCCSVVARTFAEPYCTARVPCYCVDSSRAVTVPSCGSQRLCSFTPTVSGSPNFGWVSSAAPPDLQGCGTSAMQKSIYSHWVARGREGEAERRGWSETETTG